jgi:hypothetical protein
MSKFLPTTDESSNFWQLGSGGLIPTGRLQAVSDITLVPRRYVPWTPGIDLFQSTHSGFIYVGGGFNMEEILTALMEQEQQAVEKYKDIARRARSSTERDLINRILAQKNFEIETLRLLCSGNVPDRFIAFGTIIDDEVNFRDAPSPSGSLLAVLDRGTPVILTERRGNWVGLQLYDGRSGWVFKDYVRAND